ncbi:cyclase family protein [Haloferula chungangensis]|uniref:Cyclase family protein n=1 Tax=Haloferula chungangensis TaxID=1048331 RepID=A0ABW2L6Z8_9BACT
MAIYDLSRSICDGDPGVRVSPARTLEKDGWNASTLELYSHSGTHMDAPWHFGCGEATIDETPLSTCMGPAHIVRLPDTQDAEWLTVGHLGALAENFTAGHSLILHTGWSRFFDQPDIYRRKLPRISEELARWCVEKRVRMLGVEPPSVADVNSIEEVTTIHQILLGGGVTIIEGLVNLESIPTDHCHFAAFPLKIHHGDGSPCRALASDQPFPSA